MSQSDPLEFWQNAFGDDYTERNAYAGWKIENGVQVFRRMIGDLPVQSILEVGSNIGLNLLAINRLFGDSAQLYAVEPNKRAFDTLTAHEDLQLADAWQCDAYDLPLPDDAVDLAFTSGVLIHIPPSRLQTVTQEIVRVARRYVLCVEYFSHTPVEIPYHDHQGLLFKRDFGAFYQDTFPDLNCLAYGFIWQREFPNFDDLNWWLFEKARSSQDNT